MILRFAYLKMVSPKQRVFAPASAVTTFVQGQKIKADPMGGTGVNAPSTLIIDDAGNQYHLNKAFSAVNAVITAVTSDAQNISIL